MGIIYSHSNKEKALKIDRDISINALLFIKSGWLITSLQLSSSPTM